MARLYASRKVWTLVLMRPRSQALCRILLASSGGASLSLSGETHGLDLTSLQA